MSLGKEIDELIDEYRREEFAQVQENREFPGSLMNPGLYARKRSELIKKIGDLLEEYKF